MRTLQSESASSPDVARSMTFVMKLFTLTPAARADASLGRAIRHWCANSLAPCTHAFMDLSAKSQPLTVRFHRTLTGDGLGVGYGVMGRPKAFAIDGAAAALFRNDVRVTSSYRRVRE